MNLQELYENTQSQYSNGMLFNMDCMDLMKQMNDNIVNLTLTDIPYGEVNREDNGLRNLNKENADIMTFDLEEFLNEVYRVTESTIIIFCGIEQVSPIAKYFSTLQKKKLSKISGCVFYLDPPYKGTKQYEKQSIDYNYFYDFCRRLSKNNIVLISEYNMPQDFTCIWEKERTVLQKSNRVNGDKATEKLFIYNKEKLNYV